MDQSKRVKVRQLLCWEHEDVALGQIIAKLLLKNTCMVTSPCRRVRNAVVVVALLTTFAMSRFREVSKLAGCKNQSAKDEVGEL
jgi:hypothetical protein